MGYLMLAVSAIILLQVASAASLDDKYEPMVAFICDRPAMHRGVNSWVPDASTDCLEKMEDVLAYCQETYPDHNITNVVEASYLVTIQDWPMRNSMRTMPHRVRPFRCLVGGFQSDALLVPQHCEFDHRHDQSLCEGFSHWNVVAEDQCHQKGARLESFGMLLNCELGKFSGVEYVCCPEAADESSEAQYHSPQDDDMPDTWGEETTDSSIDDFLPDENTIDLYEAYLRGQKFPLQYDNEHKRFLAAKKRMKQNQQKRVTKLLQDWQAAREHVDAVRKTDPKGADGLAKEITERFQSLYSAYEVEHSSQKEQLVALHLQHVQAALNDRKRETMDNYLRALENSNADEIIRSLQAYIKAEERDRLHTVNHYEHVRSSSSREALRIHPFIVNHLRLSEQRIDQALEMLSRYPDIEEQIKPQMEEFMSNFNAIASSIRDVVIPVPEVEEEESASDSESSDSYGDSDVSSDSYSDEDDDDFDLSQSSEEDSQDSMMDFDEDEDDDDDDDFDEEEDDDEEIEDEHDYERKDGFARHMDDSYQVRKGSLKDSVAGGRVGGTLGFALGGVSVFVIIVVAVVMVIRRRNNPQFVSHSYVEVDPSASPEERHVANMQMNGYENPTYMYFEQQPQNNPRA